MNRILLGRAQGQGGELAANLRQMGYEVYLQATVDFEYLGHRVEPSVFNRVVFPSTTAVQFFSRFAKESGIELSKKTALSVGPTTAKALLGLGFKNVLSPANPPYDSDALYSLMNKKGLSDEVSFITSSGGRRVIQQELDKTGGLYNELFLYKRIVNQNRIPDLVQFCPEVIVISSYDVWRGTYAALGQELPGVKLILVPSKRVARLISCEAGMPTEVFNEFKAPQISKIITRNG